MAAFQGEFNTVCTKPTTPYHFVDSGDIRGTMDIFWPSIAALLLCTYSIQHLAVPYPKEPRNVKERLWNVFIGLARKPMHMMLALVVPELMVGFALADLLAARTSEREMQKWAEQDGTEWSLTHAFFANLGGFVLRLPSTSDGATSPKFNNEGDNVTDNITDDTGTDQSSDSTTPHSKEAASDQGTKHGGLSKPMINDLEWQALPSNLKSNKQSCPFSPAYCPCQNEGKSATFEYMLLENIQAHKYAFRNGRFRIQPGFIKPFPPGIDTSHISRAICDFANAKSTTRFLFYELIKKVDRIIGRCWVLDAKQLLMAREFGVISRLPSVSSDELKDQSKGDALVKLIAMGQIIYLVMQLCLRKAQALPSSLLEVMVVAFAACALLTYGLLLEKPQDIGVPRYIEACRSPTPLELAEIVLAGPVHVPMSIHAKMGMTTLSIHVGSGTMHNKLRGDIFAARIFLLGGIVGGTIFGGIHCAAWDFEFPTPVERLLWRIACLIIVILPIPSLMSFGLPPPVRRCIAGLRKKRQNQKPKDVQTQDAFFISIMNGIAMFGALVYFVCRLFMLCEVTRALFYLPPGAFLNADWMAAIPHLS